MDAEVGAEQSENNMHICNTGLVEAMRGKLYVTTVRLDVSHLDDESGAGLISGLLKLKGPMFPLRHRLKRVGRNRPPARYSLGTQAGTQPEIHGNILVDFGICGRKWTVTEDDVVHCIAALLQHYGNNFDAYRLNLRAVKNKKAEYERVGLLEMTGAFYKVNIIGNVESWLHAGIPAKMRSLTGSSAGQPGYDSSISGYCQEHLVTYS